MSEFDLEKAMANGGKCQTRDGRPARIICTDRKGYYSDDEDYQIIALVEESENLELVYSFGFDGVAYNIGCHSELDLVNIPEKFRYTGWVNVYPDTFTIHQTKDNADNIAADDRIARIKINIEGEEGQFDE